MAGPEPQRSIGMHPHQTSDGAPVDTEEDMMDLDSPLKVRPGTSDGMDVDASEPPSFDAVGATRKQPAPVGGRGSEACGATERRNVAAESSACPTRIIHSKPLATAGAASVSTTRTLPRQPTARTGTSVAGAGGNPSSTVMPGGTAGRTNTSFAASTVSSSAAAEQASTSRTDHQASTAKVTAETARPGIGGYETAAIDTRRHANDENREKTVAHFHGSGINETSKAPDLHRKPESNSADEQCKSPKEGKNAVGKDDRASEEPTYYGHAHPPYPGYSQYYRHHYHPHHAAMHYHHSSKGPGGKDASSTSMSVAQQQAAHQYQAHAYHQWYQAYGRQYHQSHASRNTADSKKSQDKEKDGKDDEKNDKPKDGSARLAKSLSKADDETAKTEDMSTCKQSTAASVDSTSEQQVPSATSWESQAAAQAAAAHAYAAQAHHSYWSRYYSHHAQSSSGQHGYWPGYHSNDIRWSGSNLSNNTNAATAGSGNLSEHTTVGTYGSDSENFKKRHRDAPRHRADNVASGKSESRDGAVADARDDFNTLPGIDDDSASTLSIGGFSMGSLSRPPFILPESVSPQNSKRRKGTGRSQAIHRAQPANADSDDLRLINANSTLSEGNMIFTNLSINNSYSAELAAFYDPSPTNSIETKNCGDKGGKIDLGKTPKKDNKSAKKTGKAESSLVFRLDGDSKTPEAPRTAEDLRDGGSPTMFDLIGGAETPTTGLLMAQFMENTTTEDLNRHMRSHAFTPMPVAWPMANDESYKTASKNSLAASGDPHNTSGFSITSNVSWTMSIGDASQGSAEKRLLEITPRCFGLLDSTKSSKTNNPLGSPRSFWKETASDRNRVNDEMAESKPSETQGTIKSINSLLSPTMRNMETTIEGDTLEAIRSMSPLPLYYDGDDGEVPVLECTDSNEENIESAPTTTAPRPLPVLSAVPSSTGPILSAASSSSDINEYSRAKSPPAIEAKPLSPKSKPQSPKTTKPQTAYPKPIHPAHSSWVRPMAAYSGHPPPHWPMPPMPPGTVRHPAAFGKHGSSPVPPGPPPPHPAAIPPPPYPQGMYPPHHYNPHDRVRNLRGKGPPRHTMPPSHMLPPHHYGHFSPMRSAPPGAEREEPDFHHGDSSERRCAPLKPPIPPKFHGDMQKYAEFDLPEFSALVNFPSNSSGSSKTVIPLGMKHCVMCGTVCHTSGSAVKKAKQQGKTPLGNSQCNAAISQGNNPATIPMQNKGLCTNCDVGVWVVISTGVEIKWCKGCKNFRTWAAFGDKGLATKCVRCRDRQREKYAQSKRDQDRRRAAVPSSVPAAARKLPLQPSSRQHGVE